MFHCKYPPSVQSLLPVELLELVFESTACTDLVGVVPANSVFHKVASRVLYRSITGLTPRRSVRLVKTLSQNDLYASLVHHIDLDWRANILTGNFLRLLHRALKRLTSLTQLDLEFSATNNTNLSWLLQECPFSLRSFTTSLRCDAALERFLERQNNLTELCLRGFSPLTVFTVSRHAMPHLTHLQIMLCSSRTTADLIRRRPVETVSISVHPGDVTSSLDALLLSSRTVKRLTVMSFDIGKPSTLLDEVAKRLPNLEALHVLILTTHFTHDMFIETGKSLSGFKALKYLTFVAPGSPSSLEDERAIVASWHKACLTLKTIILPQGVIWAYVDEKWVCWRDDVDAGGQDAMSIFASRHGGV